jgi:hypothetical protein
MKINLAGFNCQNLFEKEKGKTGKYEKGKSDCVCVSVCV